MEYSFLKLAPEYADAILRLPKIDLQVGAVRIVKGPTGKTLEAFQVLSFKRPVSRFLFNEQRTSRSIRRPSS